jgi:hypothetical protein
MPSRVSAIVLMLVIASALSALACGGIFAKQYEYEEELYLATDGSATVVVNASIPALMALRGLILNPDPSAHVDRTVIRAAYESPIAEVTRITSWRRHGRRFVQVRLHVSDIRKLSAVVPFSWSRYELTERDGQRVFQQTVAESTFKPGTLKNVGWTGKELVGFRLHLASAILWHNARDLETGKESSVQRGNILAWEQLLADRLEGRPVSIEVRTGRESILSQTLVLFLGAFLAAVLVLVFLIWLMLRKGRRQTVPAPSSSSPFGS